MKDLDERFMHEALSLATKGWGRTKINPLVGAVVVKNSRIVGRGFHRKLGEMHAEFCALIEAGRYADGATLYINLEPCCSYGRTPPCVYTILKSKIRRVVIGMEDPNPLVNGKGIEFLRKNNIEVQVGILKDSAAYLNRCYKKYITTKIPYIILKIACSKDGRIKGFKDKYITSLESRRFVHSLRGQVDGVLVGINTILKDNSYLTDRLVGRNNPTRITLDPHLKIPLDSNFLLNDARRIIFTGNGVDAEKIKMLRGMGVEVIQKGGDYYPLKYVFEELGRMEIGSIMVEGGGILFSEVLSQGFYDEIYIFEAPQIVGSGIDFLKENKIDLKNMEETRIGEDRLYVYRNY